MSEKFDLVVIGAGPGGYEAAVAAAKSGLSTAIVEKDHFGGTCLNRGCIPTKTMLHAAELFAEAAGAGRFGIEVPAPAVNMEMLARHREATIEALRKAIAMLFRGAKVRVFEGAARILGGGRVGVALNAGGETEIEAENILLASGSTPAVPPIPGRDLPGVMTSDGMLAWRGAPPKSLIIIGGGVIGVEFAGIWQAFGTKVTIIEALPALIANMDKELGQSLRMLLRKRGAEIHTSARVLSLEKTENGLRCNFEEGGKKVASEAEAVLIATGRRPYTEGLFAEGAAPAMERGRITVSENFETSIPGLYAVGDVSSRIQLAHAATAQGLEAVRHIATGEPCRDVSLIPGCIYTTPEIASIGLTLDEAKARGLRAASHKTVTSANGKCLLSLQERGFIKVVYLEDSHVIIGAQMMAPRATDMISEFTVAIEKGLTLEEMAAVVRPHPTFNEMVTRAVRL